MMSVSYSLIFICVSIIPTATSRLNFIDWQCGSEDLSRQVAYESVMDHCPEVAPQMNHCCAVHDDCYTHQLGQKKCDADFCECSLRVTNESRAGACKPIVDISCELMDWVGWYAYANSVNYTEPAGIKKYTLDIDVLGQKFGDLYGECPRVNSTMSSCALIFNLCSDSSEKCAESLCNCMYEAYKMDKSARCGAGTHEMCEAVKRETIGWLRRLLQPHNIGSNVMVVLAVMCTLTLLCFVIRLWQKDFLNKKDVKYTAVV